MGEEKIKRIVLDTNTIISAFGWNGNERKLLNLCIDGKIKGCMSHDTFKEFERVIDYPRLNFTENEKKRFIRLIIEVFEFVKPNEKIDLYSTTAKIALFLKLCNLTIIYSINKKLTLLAHITIQKFKKDLFVKL